MAAALVVVTHDALSEIATTTAEELKAMWEALGSWNRADVARLAEQARPLLQATTSVAAEVQATLITDLVGSSAIADTSSLAIAQTARLEQAFHATWHQLAEGTLWEDAMTSGAAQLDAIGFDSTFQAARDTTSESARTIDAITGQERVASGSNTCSLCMEIDGKVFGPNADAGFSVHDRCSCMAVPLTS